MGKSLHQSKFMGKIHFKKAVSFFALASVFSLSACQKEDLVEEQAAVPALSQGVQASNIIEGQYIVVFKSKTESASEIINDLVASREVEKTGIKGIYNGRIKGFYGRLSKNQVQLLLHDPEVLSIEPDQLISLGKPTKGGGGGGTTEPTPTPTPTPTDPTYAGLTVMAGETIPTGVAMVGYGDGAGRTAWVIDSGVDATHPDLNVDATRSVSFVTGVTSVQDGFGHGTMVAGVIGAKNNGSGIIGVAANATIVALRVLDDAGAGTLSNLIRAVDYVTTNGQANDVVNISISAGASSTLDTSIKNCAAKGIFISIAAGNSAVDCSNNSPQRVNATNVYTVSGMDYNKYFWSSSNFGAPVDRCAPAVGVQTTTKGGGYTSYANGTSFAAPHVAGLLLLKGNAMGSDGTVIGDKDNTPDPVAKL
ncbi:S8 family serine peptidase [Adhaeribacter aquaticus]|uniref:S8 family serine peptidase n=1 Tax=Adhaeribacter aquaticus TaxID=299567 RepID=UPI0003FB6EF9|nr:S8 family serine peptidase [Adhaeribacter aquaticus]